MKVETANIESIDRIEPIDSEPELVDDFQGTHREEPTEENVEEPVDEETTVEETTVEETTVEETTVEETTEEPATEETTVEPTEEKFLKETQGKNTEIGYILNLNGVPLYFIKDLNKARDKAKAILEKFSTDLSKDYYIDYFDRKIILNSIQKMCFLSYDCVETVITIDLVYYDE